MSDICNGFLDEYVQYSLFVLLVFHRNEQISVMQSMKCKVCSNLAKQLADLSPLSRDIWWPRVEITLRHIRWQINWEISLPVELN